MLVCGVTGFAILLGEAAVFCVYGTTHYDEGGFAYQGWLTVVHGWAPYRDYYGRMTPLVYYIYGLGQCWFGPSLLVARLTSVLFAVSAIGLAAVCARRLAGSWAATLVPWLFAANPAVLSYLYHGLAVGIAAFFTAFVLCCLTWVRRPVAGAYLGAMGISLVLLCRHDLLPIGLVGWAYLLVAHRAPLRHRLAALALGGTAFLGVMLPFFIASPENVLCALTVGRSTPPDVRPQAFVIGCPVTLRAVSWNLMIWIRYHATLIFIFVPAGILGARAAITAGHLRDTLAANRELVLVFAVGFTETALCQLGVIVAKYSPATILYPYDFLPLAVATAVTFVKAAEHVKAPAFRDCLVGLALMAIVLVPGLTGMGPTCELSLARPTALERMASGARFVAEHTTPEDRIFTTDDPHQFLLAKRFLLPSLLESFYGFRDSRSTDTLRTLHLFNQEIIREWLQGRANVVVLSEESLNWVRSSGRYAGGESLYRMILAEVEANYDLVASAEKAYPGGTRIYRLRSDRPGRDCLRLERPYAYSPR